MRRPWATGDCRDDDDNDDNNNNNNNKFNYNTIHFFYYGISRREMS